MDQYEEQIDSTKRTPEARKKSDAEMMQAVLRLEKEGWTRLTSTSLQYIRPTGYGFVIQVEGNWEWISDRIGVPREQGTCILVEAAMQQIQNRIN